jgi:aspartyl/asparaginyl-tRNA synthetase
MGKATFFDLGDISGRMQCYLSKGDVGDEAYAQFIQLVDIGDFVGVEGFTFITKRGEKSIHIKKLTPLSKALRPLPDKWHGIADKEIKYRQRYLDLISNDRSREIFVTRSKMVAAIRNYMQERGFLEVETPMMQDVPGGAAAKPFETFFHALNQPMFLRIAPELFLKRLLVAGFTQIFELNRNFRNEGMSRRHNPEFTMLEAYWAYADFEKMADLVEGMICHLAETSAAGSRSSTRTKTAMSRRRSTSRDHGSASATRICSRALIRSGMTTRRSSARRVRRSWASRSGRTSRTTRSRSMCLSVWSRLRSSIRSMSRIARRNSCRWRSRTRRTIPSSMCMSSSSTARRSAPVTPS